MFWDFVLGCWKGFFNRLSHRHHLIDIRLLTTERPRPEAFVGLPGTANAAEWGRGSWESRWFTIQQINQFSTSSCYRCWRFLSVSFSHRILRFAGQRQARSWCRCGNFGSSLRHDVSGTQNHGKMWKKNRKTIGRPLVSYIVSECLWATSLSGLPLGNETEFYLLQAFGMFTRVPGFRPITAE